MNFIFNAILFYIYSGVALAGICAGKSSELCGSIYETDAEYDKTAERRVLARTRMVQAAQEMAMLFTHSVTTTIVANNQNNIIQAYEAAKAHNDAVLKAVPAVNQKGA